MLIDQPAHHVVGYARGNGLTEQVYPVRTEDRQDAYRVRDLSTVDLERVRRELRAQVGLVIPRSAALAPIMAHLGAVTAELDRRALLASMEPDQCA